MLRAPQPLKEVIEPMVGRETTSIPASWSLLITAQRTPAGVEPFQESDKPFCGLPEDVRSILAVEVIGEGEGLRSLSSGHPASRSPPG
jgi:hypothetical protein